MSVVVDIHLESDLSEFTSTVTDSGDLSWSNDATAQAVASTAGALKMVIDDANDLRGQINFNKSSTVRFRFYIDPNTLTMANSDSFVCASLAQVSSQARIAYAELSYTTGGGYRILSRVIQDGGSPVVGGANNITDAPHYIEFLVVRATSDVSADGSAEVWIDGVSVASGTGIDNYNQMFDQNWSIRVGAMDLSGGSSGTFYIDEIKANDDGAEIGPLSSAYTISMTEAATGGEAVTVQMASALDANVTQGTTTGESITVQVATALDVSVTQAATAGEVVTVRQAAALSVSVIQAATTGEGVTVGNPFIEPRSVNLSDGAIVGESVSAAQVSWAFIDDLILGYYDTYLLANVTDGATVGEAVSVQQGTALVVSETQSVTVGESASSQLSTSLAVGITEPVTVGEAIAASVVASGVVNVNITDTAISGEVISVHLAAALSVDITDGVTGGEAVTILVGAPAQFAINTTSGVTVGEIISIEQGASLTISVTDGAVIGEAVSLNLLSHVNVSEAVTVGDITVTQNATALGINVTDGVTIGTMIIILGATAGITYPFRNSYRGSGPAQAEQRILVDPIPYDPLSEKIEPENWQGGGPEDE